jgi:hypothetical protein
MKRDERECKPKPLEKLNNVGNARVGATDSIPAAPTTEIKDLAGKETGAEGSIEPYRLLFFL